MNYYEILQVSEHALNCDIEGAYHALVEEYYQYTYVGDLKYVEENIMKQVDEAYAVLSNANMRRKYDVRMKKSRGECERFYVAKYIKEKLKLYCTSEYLL